MDENTLTEIRARHAVAFRMVCDLAQSGGQSWRMCIPVQPTDSDRCITASLDDVPALLDALAAVTAERDAARADVVVLRGQRRDDAALLDMAAADVARLHTERDTLAAALDALTAHAPLVPAHHPDRLVCVYCRRSAPVDAPGPHPHDADCAWARAQTARGGLQS